jgi:hypothetical protein
MLHVMLYKMPLIQILLMGCGTHTSIRTGIRCLAIGEARFASRPRIHHPFQI